VIRIRTGGTRLFDLQLNYVTFIFTHTKKKIHSVYIRGEVT
jgi:hypothetical protein